MKAVIMAGGKGTRIAALKQDVPKPMIPIQGKPVLEYILDNLRRQGCCDVILAVGHLKEVIMQYFGDGSKFGLTIRYVEETEPLGTAGALTLLREELTEDFFLLNGDIIFDIDLQRMERYHREKKALVTLFTHPNDHPYDSGIIVSDDNARVIDWLHKEDERTWYRNRVNAGIHILSADIYHNVLLKDLLCRKRKIDLDRDILRPLIPTGEVYVYDSPEYVKDMGTVERYHQVEADLHSGKITARNLSQSQKAVFLDRDGTINQYRGFLRKADDMVLLSGVSEAIRRLNQSDYLVIVVTNQPVIARGEVTVRELETIHNKMETLLGKDGAYVNAIYYCPHHPDKGFEGEIEELKIPCQCRKPQPGMLLKAGEDFNIDLERSWMVGDSIQDIQAGNAAGCHTILLAEEKQEGGQDMTVASLIEAADYILDEKKIERR